MKLLSVKLAFKKDEAGRCFWDCLVRLSLTGLNSCLGMGGEKKKKKTCFVLFSAPMSHVMTLRDVVPHSPPHPNATAPWLCTNFFITF